MSMNQVEVIGGGWGRTGTHSFKNALEILGYNPTYHMVEVIENNHVKFWQRMVNGEKCDFDEVFFAPGGKRYTATCDFPSALFWREQLKQYPNAVVVITIRDPEKWYHSCTNTIFCASSDSPFTSFWVKVSLWLGIPRPGFGRFISDMYHHSFGGSWEKSKIIASYKKHIEDIKRECPPEKLLIFEVSEGWEPLCKFLKKPVPDVPFPRVNDTAEFKRILTSLAVVGYAAVAAAMVVPAIAGYFVWKYYA